MQLAFIQNWWLFSRWNMPPVSMASTNFALRAEAKVFHGVWNAVGAGTEVATVNFNPSAGLRMRIDHDQFPGD